jgi:hypothetical protein
MPLYAIRRAQSSGVTLADPLQRRVPHADLRDQHL